MKIYYLILAIFFIGGSVAEMLATKDKDPEYYHPGDLRSSVLLMLAGLVVDLVARLVVTFLLIPLSHHAVFDLGYQWWVWLLCYILWDFVFYIKHYLEHNVRFMWAIHVNHHSSEYMNLSTSLRSGVFKSVYRYFFWAVPIALGFPIPMFLILYGVGKVWAFFSHSQKLGKWGILEKILITPSHHLVHHSCNEDHLNRNFGETFLIWDKLFGTYKDAHGKLTFGIGEKVSTSDFGEVVFHEFRKMCRDLKRTSGFSNKLKIVFGKP